MFADIFNFQFQAAFQSSPDDEDALRAIDLLYDAALVSSGYTVSNLSLYFYCCFASRNHRN